MEIYSFRTAILVGMIAAILLFLAEIRNWRHVSALISRRQKKLRICQFVMFEAILAMIFLGPRSLMLSDLYAELVYWIVALSLVAAILWMALLDVREVASRSKELRKRVIRGLREEDQRKN